MYIAEARSHNDGIEFFINDKNIIISAKRNENGEIVITKEKEPRTIKKGKSNVLFAMIAAIIGTFILQYGETIDNYKFNVLSFLALVWLLILSYYFIQSKISDNASTFRYHASEHKVLNYWDKYKEIPPNCEELMKIDSVSWRCGSTLIAVFLILITLLILGILFIPWIILKIIWCAVSMFITLYLWANGKCNFLQKCVLKNPGYDEVEVALCGFREYIKEKQS